LKPRLRYYGEDILRTRGQKIRTVTSALLTLIQDMIRLLGEHDGLGLAAQQAGQAQMVAVMAIDSMEDAPEELLADGERLVLVNPEIAEEAGAVVDEEGCLSFPGLYIDLKRPERLVVCGQRLLDDKLVPVEIEARGLFARALCHEIDHLNGVLLIDHLSPFQRVRALALWKRKLSEALEKEGEDSE